MLKSKERALTFARLAKDKKAEGIVILDMRDFLDFTDYFVVCNGKTGRHIRAISRKIDEEMSKKKNPISHIEGTYESGWVLMDYGNIVGHIFSPEKREFYDLESLWADAPSEKLKQGA